MGRKRRHMVSLPAGVHRVTRRNGRVAFYWRPGRGTPWMKELKHQWCRLPDDPASQAFYSAIETARSPHKGEVDRAVSEYMESPQFRTLAPSSQSVYRLYLNKFAQAFAEASLKDILPHHVAGFQDALAATPSAADMAVTCVKILYVWAIRKGYATMNPAREIRKQHHHGKQYEPWPDWAIELISSMPSEPRIACMLALYTGQRMGDVVNMQLGHIKGQHICITQQKTGKYLEVLIHRDLRTVMEKCRARGSIYLVSMKNGKPYTTAAFRAAWSRMMKIEKFGRIAKEGFVFHGLRKSAVVRLLEAGCSTAETGAITGQTLQTVNHYAARVNQRKLGDAAIVKQEQM